MAMAPEGTETNATDILDALRNNHYTHYISIDIVKWYPSREDITPDEEPCGPEGNHPIPMPEGKQKALIMRGIANVGK